MIGRFHALQKSGIMLIPLSILLYFVDCGSNPVEFLFQIRGQQPQGVHAARCEEILVNLSFDLAASASPAAASCSRVSARCRWVSCGATVGGGEDPFRDRYTPQTYSRDCQDHDQDGGDQEAAAASDAFLQRPRRLQLFRSRLPGAVARGRRGGLGQPENLHGDVVVTAGCQGEFYQPARTLCRGSGCAPPSVRSLHNRQIRRARRSTSERRRL